MYDPHALLTLVLVGAGILVGATVAKRTGLPAPVVLLVVGVLLSLTPALHDFAMAPEVVILLFLPALLYWESLTTSLREIRADLRIGAADLDRAGADHRARGGRGRARAGAAVAGRGRARRRRRADRRDRGGGPGQAARPPHADHAARGEPHQRRHRAGRVRHRGRRGHRRARPDLVRAARRVRPVLCGRCGDRPGRRLADPAGAQGHDRHAAGQRDQRAHPVPRLPARRGDPGVRRARGGGGRPRAQPGRPADDPRPRAAADLRVLAGQHVPAQRRAVRAHRAAAQRRGARGPTAPLGRALGMALAVVRRGHRHAAAVGLHGALRHPRARPPPGPAAAPGRRPAAAAERVGRLPRRGLARRGARRAALASPSATS